MRSRDSHGRFIKAGPITLRIRGLDAVLRKAERLGPDAVRAAVRQLRLDAELVMTEAKRLTPVDTGNLRASGIVRDHAEPGGRSRIRLSFGAEYAIYVHEDLEVHHPVGQAKFLEEPLRAAEARIRANVAAAIKRAITTTSRNRR